jgi:hypothetical protein
VSLRLYFDHHVPRAIAVGVRQQGIDVLTTDADGTADRDDEFCGLPSARRSTISS